jgi:dipeptidase
MCDTVVAVPPTTSNSAVWFGKNSDREPDEAQIVEHLPRQRQTEASVRCTYLEIPQTRTTYEVLLSRPFWMWGAEMGTNEHGVTIGNEAVFTKIPVADTGLTGMDLVRLALERSASAREALEIITSLIGDYGQGGSCGYRHQNFRYHNSFMIADPGEAWVLETADRYWAAVKVRGIRTISNALSIGRGFDLLAPGTFEFARERGWCSRARDFDFAKCFGDPFYKVASGGAVRRTCTLRHLTINEGRINLEVMMDVLQDHAGLEPSQGWRMLMPCAHASWQPTRRAGQTTSSMISCLRDKKSGNSLHWLTGTSSPCLSVYKPAMLGGELLDAGVKPGEMPDTASLFWQHERLHRATLQDYARCHQLFIHDQRRMQKSVMEMSRQKMTMRDCQIKWSEHRDEILQWQVRINQQTTTSRKISFFQNYWNRNFRTTSS